MSCFHSREKRLQDSHFAVYSLQMEKPTMGHFSAHCWRTASPLHAHRHTPDQGSWPGLLRAKPECQPRITRVERRKMLSGDRGSLSSQPVERPFHQLWGMRRKFQFRTETFTANCLLQIHFPSSAWMITDNRNGYTWPFCLLNALLMCDM